MNDEDKTLKLINQLQEKTQKFAAKNQMTNDQVLGALMNLLGITVVSMSGQQEDKEKLIDVVLQEFTAMLNFYKTGDFKPKEEKKIILND